LNLVNVFDTLFGIIKEDFPEKYEDIVKLAKNNRAVLTDGNQLVIFFVNKTNQLSVSEFINGDSGNNNSTKYLQFPWGRFDRGIIIEILDGQRTLNEAIQYGRIDCRGKEIEVITFFRILRIVLFVSSRSPQAYQLWKNFKDSNPNGL